MRTAVYPPSRNVGDSPTNDNSPFQIGLESSRFPGLYKPAVPDQNQDTCTNNLRARSSEIGSPSPSKHLRARSSGIGPRAGIVYPLQPRGRRPDVHRINQKNTSGNEMSASAKCSSLPSKKRRSRKGRVERRALERESRNSSFIQDACWANQRAAVPDIPAVPVRVTQLLPEASDPTSTMRTAVYPPSRNVGDSPTNDNSPFQIGLESSRFPGLYKPAVPDQNQDTWTNNLRARSSGIGSPSPSKHLRARSSGIGPRAGIVYPLQPRGRRPDVHITVEAALPEPAALLRPDLPNPESPVQPQEAPANLS